MFNNLKIFISQFVFLLLKILLKILIFFFKKNGLFQEFCLFLLCLFVFYFKIFLVYCGCWSLVGDIAVKVFILFCRLTLYSIYHFLWFTNFFLVSSDSICQSLSLLSVLPVLLSSSLPAFSSCTSKWSGLSLTFLNPLDLNLFKTRDKDPDSFSYRFMSSFLSSIYWRYC